MYPYFTHGWFLFPIIIWTLAWKGVALWKSARFGHKWWYIALLIINTLGILEILYIYVFSDKMVKSQNSEHGHEHDHVHHHGDNCC